MTEPYPDVHARIAERLGRLTGEGLEPHPYIRRRLVQHATLGDVLKDDVVPPGFLPWDTSGAVRTGLGLPVAPTQATAGLAAWAGIEALLSDASLASRAASLDFRAVAQGVEAASSFSEAHTRWARWPVVANVLAQLPGEVRAIAALPVAGGRNMLAIGGTDGSVRVWDPDAGREVARLEGRSGWVRSVVAFADGAGRVRLASGGDDGSVRVWDLDAGRQVARLEGHTGSVWSVVAFRDGAGRVRLASGGGDGSVRIWDPDAGSVRIWDPDAGYQVARLEGHTDWVLSVVAFRDDAGRVRLASGGDDGSVRIWDPASGRELLRLVTGSPVTALAAGEDERGTFLAIGGTEGRMAVVDVAL